MSLPSAEVLDDVFDLICRDSWLNVLPNSDWQPSRLPEGTIRVSVSCAIRLHFGRPIEGVTCCGRVVVGATMPEAAVNEDSDLQLGKDDVGCSP